jgi:hypothetical protein
LATIISGTKIHIAVDQNSLPVSIVIGSANEHDSTKLIDIMENISDHLSHRIENTANQFMQTRVMMQNILENI